MILNNGCTPREEILKRQTLIKTHLSSIETLKAQIENLMYLVR